MKMLLTLASAPLQSVGEAWLSPMTFCLPL